MKSIKRVSLMLVLLLLLGGTILLDPLLRFTIDLYRERFTEAGTIYLTQLRSSDTLRCESSTKLRSYVDNLLEQYYARETSYDRITGVLTAMTGTDLPQSDIERCLRSANEMETARADLARADAYFQNGDYGLSIPFYRRSLAADGSAAFRLEQAEVLYKNSVLDLAQTAMDSCRYDDAEGLLQEGLSLFAADADLSAALEDVHRLRAGQSYHTWTEEARLLLSAEGPGAAFRYVDDLLAQAPDSYELTYLDQLIRHEYEEDVCERAQALRSAGDPETACSLLTDGLNWLDSAQMQALYAEARADITFWLVDLPVLRDETADPRTGAQSTIARDSILSDAQLNAHTHSFWADIGSVCFTLDEDFKTFAGTVAFPKGEKSDIYWVSATLQIFADGRLIAEFRDVDESSSPLPFSLPVAGVRELTLVWTSEGAGGWKDWGRFAAIFDGRFMTTSPSQ